jgi:hypothetical protein
MIVNRSGCVMADEDDDHEKVEPVVPLAPGPVKIPGADDFEFDVTVEVFDDTQEHHPNKSGGSA